MANAGVLQEEKIKEITGEKDRLQEEESEKCK